MTLWFDWWARWWLAVYAPWLEPPQREAPRPLEPRRSAEIIRLPRR